MNPNKLSEHIMVIRSVFCPNEQFLNICIDNLKNLMSFIKFVQTKNMELTFSLCLYGWVKKEYREYFNLTELQNIFYTLDIDLWCINYGKYKILNNIIELCRKNICDSIFYSDHDIIFDQNDNREFHNLFQKLNQVIYQPILNMTVGIVMLNQKGDVRHQYDIYENSFSMLETVYVYPNMHNFTSIASGCFYSKCIIFSSLPLFNLDYVYGLDDYYIVYNLNKNGYAAVIIKDACVDHPFNVANVSYLKWKQECTINIIKNITSTADTKNNYYSQIEQSMNLW